MNAREKIQSQPIWHSQNSCVQIYILLTLKSVFFRRDLSAWDPQPEADAEPCVLTETCPVRGVMALLHGLKTRGRKYYHQLHLMFQLKLKKKLMLFLMEYLTPWEHSIVIAWRVLF